MKEFAKLTATDVLAGLRAGDFACEQLVRSRLARIAERDSDVRAWVHLNREYALSQARECDKSEVRGALHGLPVGIAPTVHGSTQNSTRHEF